MAFAVGAFQPLRKLNISLSTAELKQGWNKKKILYSDRILKNVKLTSNVFICIYIPEMSISLSETERSETSTKTSNQHRYDKHPPLRRNVGVTVNSAKFVTYIKELIDSRFWGDCRPIVGWHWVDSGSTVGRSVGYHQPTVGVCSLQCGRLVEYQSTLGWHATDNSSTVERYLIDSRSTVDYWQLKYTSSILRFDSHHVNIGQGNYKWTGINSPVELV